MYRLPKLYRVVNLKFWGLRCAMGWNGGVIFDVDTQVTRKCRRVLCDDGWKWQIVTTPDIIYDNYMVESDQECLNEIGMDETGFEVVTV